MKVQPLLLLTNPKTREEHNFTTHIIGIEMSCIAESSFDQFLAVYIIGIENIIINEIITLFQGKDVAIKNLVTNENWFWGRADLESYYQTSIVRLGQKVWTFFKVVFGFMLVSNITTLYIKMTIICTPIVLIYVMQVLRGPQFQLNDRLHLYRTFPWVGMYIYALSFNPNRRLEKYVLLAFLAMILIFYCIYLTSILIWNGLLFYKSFPKGIDENFYGLMACLEFAVLVFLRTRSSIKYYPQYIGVAIIMFLTYVNMTAYGFYSMALLILASFCLGLLCHFLLTLEVPALQWNAALPHTPSIRRPRAMYFPAFSLNWITDLPQLWTMFFPLVGRDGFRERELSYVDGNNEELNNLLVAGHGELPAGSLADPPPNLQNVVPAPQQPPQNEGDLHPPDLEANLPAENSQMNPGQSASSQHPAAPNGGHVRYDAFA
jgi:hypothetical protein